MFGFYSNFGTYEDRKVGRYEDGNLMVSTARVFDGRQPYETAVRHPNYNDNKMVIVEAYNTQEEAERGHARWVKTMTATPLPEKLKDCCNSYISSLLNFEDGDE